MQCIINNKNVIVKPNSNLMSCTFLKPGNVECVKLIQLINKKSVIVITNSNYE